MSKAERIRKLYAQGLGSAEIAALVGCSQEYCRVAGRQRNVPGGKSVADAKYEADNPDYVERAKQRRIAWSRRPDVREHLLEYWRVYSRKRRPATRQKYQQPSTG